MGAGSFSLDGEAFEGQGGLLTAVVVVGELLAQSFDRDPRTALHTELSDREFQVFLRLAKGATVSDIGVALSLSIKTVSTYRTRIMEKMGLQSNSDLTYYAMKNNLLD